MTAVPDDAAPTALLPCPFCGADGSDLFVDGPDQYGAFSVKCENVGCHANPEIRGDDSDECPDRRADVIAAWNRRAPATDAPAPVTDAERPAGTLDEAQLRALKSRIAITGPEAFGAIETALWLYGIRTPAGRSQDVQHLAALREFVGHDFSCDERRSYNPKLPCQCGLDALLAEIDATTSRPSAAIPAAPTSNAEAVIREVCETQGGRDLVRRILASVRSVDLCECGDDLADHDPEHGGCLHPFCDCDKYQPSHLTARPAPSPDGGAP